MKIFTTPFFTTQRFLSPHFLCQKYKVILKVFYLHIIFMYIYYRNFSFIPRFNLKVNHFIHTQTQKKNLFDDYFLFFIFFNFYFLFCLFFFCFFLFLFLFLSLSFYTTRSHNFIFFIFTS